MCSLKLSTTWVQSFDALNLFDYVLNLLYCGLASFSLTFDLKVDDALDNGLDARPTVLNHAFLRGQSSAADPRADTGPDLCSQCCIALLLSTAY